MTGKIEAPFVFGVRVEGDTFTDRHEETERLKANFTYSPTDFTEPTETTARRIFSHGFHRCPQIFRLRCCLLICAHPCNLWEFS